MRSGASPCPFDQISSLIIKKCPIIQTMVWKIIDKIWSDGDFPKIWKSSFTVLAYKKGSPSDVSNFRPITLEPVMSKIFTAFVRNRIYRYLVANNYINTELQKGFWSNISGTVEHTEMMTHLINHARSKQRSLTISLIDLRNAFGEVHHDLLKSVLNFNHIAPHVMSIIFNIYTD